MGEAGQAFEEAMKYALAQLHWYDVHSIYALYLFRIFGVISILSAISVTYLAASLKSENELFLRLPKKNLVAALSALSALSISVSGFFAWNAAWVGYRSAQFQIETLIQNAKIEKLQSIEENDKTRLFKISRELVSQVGTIVSDETKTYFDSVKSPDGPQGTGSNL